MSNLVLAQKSQSTFVAQKVVSQEGAVMKVTRLELSQEARASLRSKSDGIRTGADAGKPKVDAVRR